MPQTRLLLDFLWQMSWLGHHTFQKYMHPEDTKSLYFLVQWETKKIMHSWNEPHSHQLQLLWYWNWTFFLFFGKFCCLFLYCADLEQDDGAIKNFYWILKCRGPLFFTFLVLSHLCYMTRFFIRKLILCLSFKVFNIMLEISLRYFLIFLFNCLFS